MNEHLEASLRRTEELRIVKDEIESLAVDVQHSLGGIMELAGKKPGAKDEFGRKIGAFESCQTSELLGDALKQEILNASRKLKEYRNRLAHDRWTSLTPRGDVPAGAVMGTGEKYLTTTNMHSLVLVRGAMAVLECATGAIYDSAYQRSIGIPAPEVDEASLAKQIQAAMSKLEPDSESTFLWHQIEAEE